MSQRLAPERARLGGLTRRRRPGGGGRPTVRFVIASGLTVAYVAFGVYVSTPWRADLREAIGPVMAWVIPICLAYVPGVLVGFLVFTLLTLRYRVPSRSRRRGRGRRAVAAGDGGRRGLERGARDRADPRADRRAHLRRPARGRAGRQQLDRPHRRARPAGGGATRAASTGGSSSRRPASTTRSTRPSRASRRRSCRPSTPTPSCTPRRSTYLVARVDEPTRRTSTSAPAPAPWSSRTPTRNLLTRMQGWDYRLGINGVKRMQAAYNSALVAQGAFSAYWTDDLRAVGGWPDAIGEDIVLTWTLMDSRGIVQYEPCALGLHRRARAGRATSCASDRAGRAACSRACSSNPPRRQPRCWPSSSRASTTSCRSSTSATSSSGSRASILFIAGYPLIFSWWSMLVIPITLIIYGLLRRWQERHVFRRLGVRPQAGHARLLRLPVRAIRRSPRRPPCAATCSTSPEPRAAGSSRARGRGGRRARARLRHGPTLTRLPATLSRHGPPVHLPDVPPVEGLSARQDGAQRHHARVPAGRQDRRARLQRRGQVDGPAHHGRHRHRGPRRRAARARRDRRPARAGAPSRREQGRARQRRGRRGRDARAARPLQRAGRQLLRRDGRRVRRRAGADRRRRRVEPRHQRRVRDGRAAPAAGRRRRHAALRRRAPPRRAVPAAARRARPAAARRADQPPRRRVGRVARAPPGRLQGHRRGRDPRSLLPRQRRGLDPRARPLARHPLRGQLLELARAEAEAPGAGGEDREGAPAHDRRRARLGAPEPQGPPDQAEGAPAELRGARRPGAQRQARRGPDPHPDLDAPGQRRRRGREPAQGLRRQPAHRGPQLLAAAAAASSASSAPTARARRRSSG